ncbi:MAG TPA: tetratricopeptide repeat protein [Gemmatimonadaceae bacterium]|nr:tetratricopeptide repeat protein [Gemmatimonadaceae bacterium]
MGDSATGLERSYDHAAYSPMPSGPNAPSDIAHGQESVETAQSELASLIRLGTIKQDAGSYAEAEECFRHALEIGDRTFGPENPDLIILLNDLTRLYLKQSAYTSAEPLLLRLLELKRSKGEDHPEVATVLASLATVRQALGMHESSEQLWRRVLDIRERTLAPNHFATASALEHLGNACAARGKIREALSAFQRALTIREKTLGNDHPSLRAARERIADLQLQASDDMLDPMAVADVPSAPERYRLLSSGAQPAPILSPSPVMTAPAQPATPTPQIKLTFTASAKASPTETRPTREKKASLMIPRTYTPPASPALDIEREPTPPETIVMPLASAAKGDDASALTTATLAYQDALESVREELEGSGNTETLTQRATKFASGSIAFFSKPRVAVALVTVITMSLLAAAAATNKRAFGESGESTSETVSAPKPVVTLTAAANAIPVAANASATSTESITTHTAKPRVSEDRSSAKKVVEKKPDPPARIAIPALSTAVLSGLDSVAAKAAAVGSRAPETFSVQTSLGMVSQRRATFQDDQDHGPQRARLIGELPQPKVPPQVTDVEGEVRVRFNVDTLGRPMIETFSVISSPNPLLTAAVRKVVPGMRFEPARTAGPDARTIGDVVQIGFQFARSR